MDGHLIWWGAGAKRWLFNRRATFPSMALAGMEKSGRLPEDAVCRSSKGGPGVEEEESGQYKQAHSRHGIQAPDDLQKSENEEKERTRTGRYDRAGIGSLTESRWMEEISGAEYLDFWCLVVQVSQRCVCSEGGVS